MEKTLSLFEFREQFEKGADLILEGYITLHLELSLEHVRTAHGVKQECYLSFSFPAIREEPNVHADVVYSDDLINSSHLRVEDAFWILERDPEIQTVTMKGSCTRFVITKQEGTHEKTSSSTR
ncbi:hypothetical protein EPA93_18195 [Ktedonosporobacter rubrisoli]|uniref:Uncharacterized protein n=1 Tax=Ktedonosporobacter rubrisoli TaxID=2509675 RepID=A0A4P6JRJ0_KTERU|nr:hypothetical protein [Ktedonosporobacter rubrisoli]QBD77820.1 hypothetical protein EPA93_18195 [Ktedonosporobacter rubrisoli]